MHISKKAAAAQEKKESSAQGLEQALNRIRSHPDEEPRSAVTGDAAQSETAESQPRTVGADTEPVQSSAEEPSLDAIIAAFKKKPAAGEDKPVQPVEKPDLQEPVFTETSVSAAEEPDLPSTAPKFNSTSFVPVQEPECTPLSRKYERPSESGLYCNFT